MKKLFSDRIDPFDDWLLVRIQDTATVAKSAPKLLVVEKGEDGQKTVTAGGPAKLNHGVIVAVGPGSRAPDGTLIPVDPRAAVGATVIFPGKTCFRPTDFKKEMEDEGLWFVSASNCICRLRPEGLHKAALQA